MSQCAPQASIFKTAIKGKNHMEQLVVRGGNPLKGEVQASGAKNSITKLLVASLISDKKCIFHNVPNIGDVEVTVDLCREIGSEIQWDREQGIIEIVTKHLSTTFVPQRFSGGNRIPILMIGALLSRTREDIIVPTAGGCKIGKRSVDFHISALRALGADVEYRKMKKEGAYFTQSHDGLVGALIELPYPSVGATENAILAAVGARGKTVIRNAALEPEVNDLILFLQKMGALITLEGNRTIVIEGTKVFYEVEHHVVLDRNEVASFAAAAIASKGSVLVKGASQEHMGHLLIALRKVGAGFCVKKEGIEFFYTGDLKGGVHIETDVHPGFMTDWQQPFVVMLTQAEGMSVVHDTVYEKRFGYVETLVNMGASIELFTDCLGSKKCRFASKDFLHNAIIRGKTPLIGRDIEVPDLRAGFAYVLAALIAEGTSHISGVPFLKRGYAHLTDKLQALGADIKEISVDKTKIGQKELASTGVKA
jgi:UDP-N-acetylglucosamine 1-carboxyvinyltransferase